MRNIIVYSIISIIVTSCSSSNYTPEGIIPDSTMTNLVVEFSLIEASYNQSLMDPSSPKFRPELFYENVLKDKGYTRNEFINSLNWYTGNTKRFLNVYDEALISLSKQQTELNRQ